jgi:hypothetical protein
MDSYVDTQFDIISISIMIRFFFSSMGIIVYSLLLLLFTFYNKSPSLIKNKIFGYILFYSIKLNTENFLPSSLKTHLYFYCIKIILFYFLITYVNNCFTSKQLIENNNFELTEKNQIILLYVVSSFPVVELYNISYKYNFIEDIMNIVLIAFLYNYINTRFQILLDYLNLSNILNSTSQTTYLSPGKANYYYENFINIKKSFFISFICIIFFFAFDILYILLNLKFLCYFSILSENIANFYLIYGCLQFFFTYNRKLFGLFLLGKPDYDDINKSSIIEIDPQQNDKDDKSTRIKRKKIENENVRNNDEENYSKIDMDKAKVVKKEDNSKCIEEAESLNK